MTDNPLVSIIIPTFNRANLIGETLDSILAQTYHNWECLVIDDGGTDHTEVVVRSYLALDKRFKYYLRPNAHKPGGNGARNYGFKLCKGMYVNWFDSDDLLHPEKLEKQMEKLSGNDHSFSVCQTLVFQGIKENALGLRSQKIFSRNALFDFVTNEIQFLTQAPLIKKSFLLENKLLFDEDLKAAQEWEFICRMLFYSPNCIPIDLPLVFYRKNPVSISYSDKDLRNYHYYLARAKFFRFLKQNRHKDGRFIQKHLYNYNLSKYFNFLKFLKLKLAFSIYKNFIVKETSLFHALFIVLLSPVVILSRKTTFIKKVLKKK